jgi:hypothetical protein
MNILNLNERNHVAKNGVRIPGKPSLCVCDERNVLKFEFHKIKGAGFHKCSCVFALNWQQQITLKISLISVQLWLFSYFFRVTRKFEHHAWTHPKLDLTDLMDPKSRVLRATNLIHTWLFFSVSRWGLFVSRNILMNFMRIPVRKTSQHSGGRTPSFAWPVTDVEGTFFITVISGNRNIYMTKDWLHTVLASRSLCL